VRVVQDELYTPFGLRTLSPRHPAYRPYYSGSPSDRDSAYHQGTAWPWLLGAFAEAHYRVFNDRDAAQSLLRGMEAQMTEMGIGTLAEIYDGGETRPEAPLQRPNGCIAQAWSVGEILHVWKDLDTSRRKH
jgi:4-alpha-glucanotransferase